MLGPHKGVKEPSMYITDKLDTVFKAIPISVTGLPSFIPG